MDIRKAEIVILEACDWNPLYTTVLELMEFYLAQGILFSTDKLKISKKTHKTPGILREKMNNSQISPPGKQQQKKVLEGQENNENGVGFEEAETKGLEASKDHFVLASDMDEGELSEIIYKSEMETIALSNYLITCFSFL